MNTKITADPTQGAVQPLNRRIGREACAKYCFYIIGISLFIRLLCLGFNNLLVEEAYYWNYAAHLDFGYLDHPPMVAVIIKLFTTIFGINEFGVRIGTLFCWCLAAFFTLRLTNLIREGAGYFAVMLLAILPFFFLHSLVITPDQPLIVCWSAALYCLYRSLVLEEPHYWYAAGIWIGLGLLSKYTIVLLGPATLLYLSMLPEKRKWLARKEPYVCLLIALLFFTPVVYWNATHDWVSFLFQSTRRFKSEFSFSLHQLLGLLILFLTPLGMLDVGKLFNKTSFSALNIGKTSQRFLQVFFIIPLSFFGIFSISHGVKFNWIGPSILAVIPWLAVLIHHAIMHYPAHVRQWFRTAVVLLCCYSGLMFTVTFGTPEIVHRNLLSKYIAWDDLTQQLYAVAKRVEAKTQVTPIIVPLDTYNIGSELSFYQAKLLAEGAISKVYPIVGRHIFGDESLMYRYWSNGFSIRGNTLILVSGEPDYFNQSRVKEWIIKESPVNLLWSHSQGRGEQIKPYYYQVVDTVLP